MLALQLTTVKQCLQLKLLAMLVQKSNSREMAQVKDRLIQKLSFLIQNPEVRNHGIQILGPFLNFAGFEGIFLWQKCFSFLLVDRINLCWSLVKPKCEYFVKSSPEHDSLTVWRFMCVCIFFGLVIKLDEKM